MKKIITFSVLLLLCVPLLLSSCSGNVMKVGGFNVSYDFYRYIFLNTRATAEEYGSYPEGADKTEYLRSLALESIRSAYAVESLAEKYEVTLTKEDEANIEADILDARGKLTDEEFKTELAGSYMNEEVYRYALRLQYLENRLYAYMISEENGVIISDDASLEKSLATDFVRVEHILLRYDENNYSEKLALADEIFAKLKSGTDFEALRKEYSDDTSESGGATGYYFTRGEFETPFEREAFALAEGETSDRAVTTTSGIHIMRRLPLDRNYIDAHYEELRREYATMRYYEIKAETAESLETDLNSSYDEFTYDYAG